MTKGTGQPSAKAHIDDLQAWATGKTKAAATAAAAASTASKSKKVATWDAPVQGAAPNSVQDAVQAAPIERRRGLGNLFAGKGAAEDAGDVAAADAKPPMSFAIKVLIGLGVAVGAYVLFTALIGIVVMVLMALGAAAAIYVAYRIGRWQGRRDARGVTDVGR